MTLVEKLRQNLTGHLSDEKSEVDVRIAEAIADEFAIGFAEWIRKETYYEHLTKEFIYKRNVYKCEKELLQIYKQEKGL